jgi:transcriptional regulator with XRE-family HTH domain
MPTIDMYATGQNIKSMVKKQKITVNKMQEAFGFNTPQAIYKWYRGDAMPTIDNFIILAAVLNTTIDNIIVTTTAA